MNVIDRILSSISPTWALRRIAARAQIDILRRALESTKPDRRSGRWSYPRQGPQTRTDTNLENSLAQARDVYFRNPIARGTLNSIVANLVGLGIQPQARVRLRTGDENVPVNQALEEAWKEWIEGVDPTGKEHYYSQQESLMREFYIAGEALVVKGFMPEREIPLTLEVIPAERLAMKDEPRRTDGSACIQGIEYDSTGRITGYWIYPNHPWEGTYLTENPQLIPADRVIHFHDQLQPGQVRGLTKLYSVAGAFEGFAQWLDWLLTKERVASAFAVAIIRHANLSITAPMLSTGDTANNTDESNNIIDNLDAGIISTLKPGESIEGISSGVQGAAVDLLSTIFLRVIARGLDCSYELVSRDLSKVTYLSARQGEHEDRRHWEPQQEAMNRAVNVPVWRDFATSAIVSGVLPKLQPERKYLRVEFIRPGREWIDPQKDVEADVKAVRAGFRSPQQIIKKYGGDPEQILADIKKWKEWTEDRELKLTVFPDHASEKGEPVKEEEDAETERVIEALKAWIPTNGKKRIAAE